VTCATGPVAGRVVVGEPWGQPEVRPAPCAIGFAARVGDGSATTGAWRKHAWRSPSSSSEGLRCRTRTSMDTSYSASIPHSTSHPINRDGGDRTQQVLRRGDPFTAVNCFPQPQNTSIYRHFESRRPDSNRRPLHYEALCLLHQGLTLRRPFGLLIPYSLCALFRIYSAVAQHVRYRMNSRAAGRMAMDSLAAGGCASN
jgi:hypothetical protein